MTAWVQQPTDKLPLPKALLQMQLRTDTATNSPPAAIPSRNMWGHFAKEDWLVLKIDGM